MLLLRVRFVYRVFRVFVVGFAALVVAYVWGMDPAKTVEVSQLAVRTGCVVLYEFENGVRRLTKRIAKRKPVADYLKHQARFRHVLDDPEALASIQAGVDERYEALLARME